MNMTARDLYNGREKSVNWDKESVPGMTYVEGGREVIQNIRDKCKDIAFDSGKTLIEDNLPTFSSFNNVPYVSRYEFRTREDNTLLGFITYDPTPGSEKAVFDNEGPIPTRFLYKIETDKRGKAHQTGTHGEGLKISGLTFIRRSDREFYVFTEAKKFQYLLEFENIGDTRETLFVVEEPITSGEKYMNRTRIEITGLRVEEWVNICKKILLFCSFEERKQFFFPITMAYRTLGHLLLPMEYDNKTRFKHELYVKGLFVQDETKEYHRLDLFGVNLYDIHLDRDRNSINSTKDRQNTVSKLLADICFFYLDLPTTVKSMLKREQLFDRLFVMLQEHNHWLNSFAPELAKLMEANRGKFPEDFITNCADEIYTRFRRKFNNPKLFAVYEASDALYALEKKKLHGYSDNFFVCRDIHNGYYFGVLKLSKYHRTVDQVIQEKIINARDYTLSNRFSTVLLPRIRDLFQITCPNEAAQFEVTFKEFEEESVKYKTDRKVYLSHLLLNNCEEPLLDDLTVRRVFSKLLEVFHVSFERVLECFVQNVRNN